MTEQQITSIDVETTTVPVAKKPAAKKAASPKAEPGPKPKFLVVEDNLKCQTRDGEISLCLIVPLRSLRQMMKLDEQGDSAVMDFLLDEVIPTPVVKQLECMSDGAEALGIVMEYSKALGDRLGASLGKSDGSSD